MRWLTGRLRGLAPAVVLAAAFAAAPISAGGAPAEARPTSADGAPSQSMRIEVRGAVAHVTVTRTLPCGASAAPDAADGSAGSRDTILDVALPDRSALLGVDVNDGTRFHETRRLDLPSAKKAYAESLRALDQTAEALPVEREASLRLRLACKKIPNNHDNLRYTFSTLLELHAGTAQLAFPAAPESAPPATRVEVRVDPADGVGNISIGGVPHAVGPRAGSGATETVSTRARWLVTLGPRPTPDPAKDSSAGGGAAAARGPVRLETRASIALPRSGTPLLAFAVGSSPPAKQALPDRVLFLIDRSRSVGPGGLEAERDLARRFLAGMAPSTRFDALFFDRSQKRLFPVARVATREAITKLDDEMVPERLANGTDLAAALRAAGDLLRREASDFAPRAFMVLLSDGAIGGLTSEAKLAESLGRLPAGVELLVAAVSVRANEEPAVSPRERHLLRRLAGSVAAGGVERAIRLSEIDDAAPSILEDLRLGGDLHDVEIESGEARGPREARSRGGAPERHRVGWVADVIPPGGGESGVVAVSLRSAGERPAPRAPVLLTREASGRANGVSARLRPARVDPTWLEPLLQIGPLAPRLYAGPALVALVDPVPRAAAPAVVDTEPQGYLERSVVRDALSLAFTPRARACYLNRTARTPADRDLSGRVRLALDLVRGEVGSARVEASTLAHPIIESCLRDAAYALDVPRAYRNDESVTAVLNLVFRPHTPDRQPQENPDLSHELDLLVEAALKAPEATSTAAPNAGTPPPP